MDWSYGSRMFVPIHETTTGMVIKVLPAANARSSATVVETVHPAASNLIQHPPCPSIHPLCVMLSRLLLFPPETVLPHPTHNTS